MPLYFMFHDAEHFHGLIRPSLADSWRQRDFQPLVALRAALEPELTRFVADNRIKRDDLLLLQIQRARPFDRAAWRLLVGEVLLLAAAEVPEINLCPASINSVLAGGSRAETPDSRRHFSLAEQLLYGANDVIFGGGWYRPNHAGYNDREDVERLTGFVDSINPDDWTDADLAFDPDVVVEDRQDELAFTRQGFGQLRAAYRRARAGGQLVFCEEIG